VLMRLIKLFRCFFPHRTNKYGIELIKQFEGFRAFPYLDTDGKEKIGFGCPVPPHTNFPIEFYDAERILFQTLQPIEKLLNGNLSKQISSDEFSALAALAFNVGISHVLNSTLFKLVNQGKFEEASEEFVKWDHEGKEVVPGLLRRREAERDLFKSIHHQT